MSIYSFSLWYQKSPIIFVGGIAGNATAVMPLIKVTESLNLAADGTGFGPEFQDLEQFNFDFYPMSGATLVENQIAMYPFANQTVAANAMIAQPLRISLQMLAPVRDAGGYDNKISVFQNLQSALKQHTRLGGTYNVATPSYVYTNCVLLGLHDTTDGDPKRPQSKWQWDFIQPLISYQEAQQVSAQLMQKLTNGAPLVADAQGAISYSGTQTGSGIATSNLSAPSSTIAKDLLGVNTNSSFYGSSALYI